MDPGVLKIKCLGYPSEFILDKNLAKDYFKQFGRIKRINFRPKQKICTVEYANEDGYINALNNAGEYKGTTFEVTSITEKKSFTTEPIWVDKDEIEAELAAMAGYDSKEYKFLEGASNLSRKSSDKSNRSWKKDTPTKSKMTKAIKKSSSITGEEVDLINLVLSQGITIEDKYKILDARDKLIKLKLKKLPPLKSGATVGTCPDMCPEKERLFREIKHQVAWYEQDENSKSMNYNKAVKQYSRSSADQEAPLAHELRPVSVLQMTIGYLLHNIVDLCDTDEVHIGDWFYFLWDRTRGIRKDITQQELCSQGAVELVEQCARFHIHCSARLVAEDPSVFDQKINTENLTKCLQTLKYMYHDLLLKGESCENEAEFRAYIILLNLNDGNFMWEVQQLRPEIQKSKEVRFALKVYSAIEKNNYVKFFKLVNSTTYLNACILMRYFIQVRIMALKTLLKSYIPRAAKTAYSLGELQYILAFDDIDSTIDFLQYYGLNMNEDSSCVILDRNNFFSPEFPYMLDRSAVVEDKRKFSVGRIVCGKDLPPKIYETHKVQNSFDSKGYLINKDILDELDLEKVKLKLLEQLDETKETTESEMKEIKTNIPSTFTFKEKPDPFIFTDKEEKMTNPFALTPKQSGSIFALNKIVPPPPSKSIFNSPQFTFTSPTVKTTPLTSAPSQDQPDFVTKTTNIFAAIPPKSTNLEQTRKGGFSFNLVTPVTKVNEKPDDSNKQNLLQTQIDLEKKRKENEEMQKKLEKEKLLEQNRLELKKQEEDKKLLEAKKEDERRQKELKKKRQEEELKRRLEEMQREQEQIMEKEIKDDVLNLLNTLVTTIDDKIREEKLLKLEESIQKRLLLKMAQKWRNNVIKNKRKRKAIDCSPMWINPKTLKQSAEELHTPSQNLTLTLMKRYKYGKSLDIGHIIEDSIDKINICQLTYQILKNRIFELSVNKPKHIFWKVLISLPDKNELTSGLNRLEETMNNAFQWKNVNGQILSLENIKQNVVESVSYCVEKQQGFKVTTHDSNGIIFVAKNFNRHLQRRIFENLKGFGVYTKIPIVIILQEDSEDECHLEKLIKENIVSDYIILKEQDSSIKLVGVIEQGLIFLAKKVENSPPLELDTLKSFVTKYLCSEIWKRANSFAKWNSNYKKCLQNPNIVIDLYNEGLDKLKSIILSESNREHAVFPEEFKKYINDGVPDFLPCSFRYFPKFWKSNSYIIKLEHILDKLRLPQWQDEWPLPNEYELELSVFKYCSKLSKKPEQLFYKVMSKLLRNIDPESNFDDIQYVFWTDIIEVLGLEKLISDNIMLPTELYHQTIFNEYFVVYDINKLNDYRYCDWFYIYNPKVKSFVEKVVEKQPIKKIQKSNSEELLKNFEINNDFIESLRSTYLTNRPDKSEIIKELKELNNSLNELSATMEIHKKISSKMDESLSRALAEK